ncbi:MAG: hypothetical protein HYX75_01255 [Acidobacteria bacterium]|nr:hypothetical protein [Acidobacteriota bacterium]
MKYTGRAISASLIGILMASGIVGLLTILNRPGSRTAGGEPVDGRTVRIVQRELWIDETLLDLSEIGETWDDATASGGGWASEDSAAGMIQPDMGAIRPYLEELSRAISGREEESAGSPGAEN